MLRLAVLGLAVAWCGTVFADEPARVNTYWTPWTGEYFVVRDHCRSSPIDEMYNKRIDALAKLALGKDIATCATTLYAEANYNAAGNEIHAGIDLRGSGNPVYAIAAGTVSAGSAFDGTQHSTLIIETLDKRYKVLYLHMSSLDARIYQDKINVGHVVQVGDKLGTVGDIGVGKGGDGAHLHIEVWSSDAPQYAGSHSLAGVNGNCPEDPVTKLCSGETILSRTKDPTILLPKLPEEVLAETKLPPLPYVFSASQIQSQNHWLGSWVLRAPAQLRAASNIRSKLLQTLTMGTRVKGEAIEFHVLRFRIINTVQPTTVRVSPVDETNEKPLALSPGDLIVPLLYTGDGGYSNVLIQRFTAPPGTSRIYLTNDEFFSKEGYEQLNPFGETETWAKVRTTAGAVGWIKNPNAKGMSRYD